MKDNLTYNEALLVKDLMKKWLVETYGEDYFEKANKDLNRVNNKRIAIINKVKKQCRKEVKRQ